MSKHQKHSKLEKPTIGKFASNEFAILGAPCSIIKAFAKKLSRKLASTYQVAYIDESHEKTENVSESDFNQVFEKRGDTQNILLNQVPSDFSQKNLLNEIDVTLVNGNHFLADKQVVILHSKKLDSLKRKLDRLTNLVAVIKYDIEEIPDFLEKHTKTADILNIQEEDKIIAILKDHIQIPPLYGLILSGGDSCRMGYDKAKIKYHNTSQLDYLKNMLSSKCAQTFISRKHDAEDGVNIVADKFIGLGAYGGILSAFQKNPNAAWLVLAIDMPNIDEAAVEELIKNRNISKVATAFRNPATNFPDPLFTIFEPKAYLKLLQYLALGYSCPRKMLINEDIQLIEPNNKKLLQNINTPEEKEAYFND